MKEVKANNIKLTNKKPNQATCSGKTIDNNLFIKKYEVASILSIINLILIILVIVFK